MLVLKNIFMAVLFLAAFSLFAEGREIAGQKISGQQIAGSGALCVLPGRPEEERRVMNQDIARSHSGDYFWREIKPDNNGKIIYHDKTTGKNWGWLYINQGDIAWAKNNNFMAGFKPKLPDMDSSGEKYMEYQKTAGYSRKLYDKGAVQDVITKQTEFDTAFAEFRRKYPNPLPRQAKNITGAVHWLYYDDVPPDFPQTFWASITLEGRVMKVIIANGPAHRIAVSFWAQDSYIKEFPDASWGWQGEDNPHSAGAKKIQEDISHSAAYYEFTN